MSSDAIFAELRRRVLVLDGAMGTMIQAYRLCEEAYRGERFAAWHRDVRGNNDLLSATAPDIIRDIHLAYLRAGAHIISTNTFNAQAISLADYGMEMLAYELNVAAARVAREAVAIVNRENPSRPRWVAGVLGPTNRTLCLSPDVNRPGYRAITRDQLVAAYAEQVTALLDVGVDLLLIETIFL